MHTDQSDGFQVYVRRDRAHAHVQDPDDAEQPLGECATYEEARRLQRAYHRSARECVIRYVGETGGGD